jgi:hypothetical protein
MEESFTLLPEKHSLPQVHEEIVNFTIPGQTSPRKGAICFEMT